MPFDLDVADVRQPAPPSRFAEIIALVRALDDVSLGRVREFCIEEEVRRSIRRRRDAAQAELDALESEAAQ
jgi:hypothetical protein